MTASRVELIIWVNGLLQSTYTKVEQLGTGVAYSQIIDSIYGDVHLAKIKFDCKHEYQYIENFKVLQQAFEKHKIDKVIPVEKLVKCRFQDNLEFLQWIKGYWDMYHQDEHYDAFGRRQKSMAKVARVYSDATLYSLKSFGHQPTFFSDQGSCASSTTSSSTALATPIDVHYPMMKCRSPSTSSTILSNSSLDIKNPSLSHGNTKIIELNQRLAQLQLTVNSLREEKDFYDSKLEKIAHLLSSLSPTTMHTLQKVKAILEDDHLV
ncbi:RP/EB family microtubule-associated protein [Halteromyces radiatus]|uniref:RP/EB family microtubule-associated protein n=1 Tax=Halteromyces radiatus TaxID=101107 RepID=UPI002220F71B|nr:RP/EB family microtubule-associated protein [Halteromyces radiatus]KAI8098959.1 RP/EB family microtubule-associated protein [Halteromyces radiatus]